MGSIRQKQTKQANAAQQKAASNNHRPIPPVEELQVVLGNQSLGRLIQSQDLSHSTADRTQTLRHQTSGDAPIQRRSLFRGLSQELMGNASQLIKPMVIQNDGLQRKVSQPNHDTAVEAAIPQGRSTALPHDIQTKMERSFDTNFANVRIHQGPQAKAIGALAYTQGNDIHFQPGQYNPQSASGQALLGHELTHVVQQRSGRVSAPSQPGKLTINTDPALEAEADRLGAKAARGQLAEVHGAGIGIQRRAAVIQREKTETTVAEKRASKKHEEEHKEKKAGAGYVTTQETSSKRSADAEAVAKKIVEASDEAVKEAVEALAKAGVFGEAAGKAAVKQGAVIASAEGSAKGSATAEAKAGASKSVKGIMEGLTLLAEASAEAKVEGSVEGRLAAAAGPLEAALSAKLKVSAHILAAAKGTFQIGLAKGLVAEGSAKVSVGVEASGEVTASLGAYEMVADLTAEGEAKAGAEASAEGKITVTLTEITASGKAEAFAGAKAKGSVSGSLKYKGKVLVKLSAEAEASAGIGGTVEGTFSIKNGKLTFGGKLAGTLGVGTGVDTKVEVDPKAIGKAAGYVVIGAVKKVKNRRKKVDRSSPSGERQPMPADEKDEITAQLYDAVKTDFEAYGKKKDKHGESGIKREAVQDILDKQILKDDTLSNYVLFKEADAVLEQAANDAFGSQLKMISIEAGNIRAFEAGTKKRSYHALSALAPAKS